MKNIDSDDEDGKDCDPDSHTQVGTPILNDKTSSVEVISQYDGILEEVVPSCGKSKYLLTVHSTTQKFNTYPRAGSTKRSAYPLNP